MMKTPLKLLVAALLLAPPALRAGPLLIFGKQFASDTIASGDDTRMIYTLENGDAFAVTDIAFAETLPAGVDIAPLPAVSNTCDGILQVDAANGEISFEDGRLSPGPGSVCEIALNVTATGDTVYMTSTGDLTSSYGNNGPAAADLDVSSMRPRVGASFAPASILSGETSTLTVTLDNTAGGPAVSPSTLTLPAPQGLLPADPLNIGGTCTIISSAASDGVTVNLDSIPMGASCTVSMDFEGRFPGTHVLTGEPFGMTGGRPVADLEVLNPTLALIKSFALSANDEVPATLPDLPTEPADPPGLPLLTISAQDTPVFGLSRVRFALDNSAGTATTVSLRADLPPGLRTALQPAVTEDCGALFQSVGALTQFINIQIQVLAATACEVSFLIQPVRAGQYVITLAPGGSYPELLGRGFITARYQALAGSVVDVDFAITNLDRVDDASGITFSDDLDAMLSGAAAVALPPAPCGPGSNLSGTSTVTLSGATLERGQTCDFTIPVQIPAAAAPGMYVNTTSAIVGDLGPRMVNDPGADAELNIGVQPGFGKTFITNPAVPSDNVELSYSISNTSPTETLTDITFNDPLGQIAAPGGITPPAPGFCGAGSTAQVTALEESAVLLVSGAELAPSDDCTFSVFIDPADNPQVSPMALRSSWLNGFLDGESVVAPPAEDTLELVTGPKLSITLLPSLAAPGGTIDLEFELEMREDDAQGASGISFTMDLNAALTGLTTVSPNQADVCGAGSLLQGTSGGTFLSFSGGSLPGAGQCRFGVTLALPAGASEGSYDLITSSASASVNGLTPQSPPASTTLLVSAVQLALSLDTNVALPGDSLMMTVTFDYTGGLSGDVDADLRVDLDDFVPGATHAVEIIADICGAGSTLIPDGDLIRVVGANAVAGSTCSFTRMVQLPASVAPGNYQGTLIANSVSASAGSGSINLPPAFVDLTISERVAVAMSVDSPLEAGETGMLTFILTNLTTDPVSNLALHTDLTTALPGLSSISPPPMSPCGGGSSLGGTSVLSLTSASLGGAGQCQFSVELQVPDGAAPGDYPIQSGPPQVDGQVAGGAGSSVLSIRVPTALTIDNPSVAAPEGGVASNTGSIARGTASVALSASVGQVEDLGNDRYRWSYPVADGPDDTQMVTIFSSTSRGGVQESVSFQLNALNVPPGLVAQGLRTFTPNVPYTLTLVETVDPGPDTATQFDIDWGDSQSDSVGSLGDISHTFTTSATSVTVRIDVTDEDGTFQDVLVFELFNGQEVPFYDSFEDELTFGSRGTLSQ